MFAKKASLIFAFSLFIACNCTSLAKIIESNALKTVEVYIDPAKKNLIAFDLDNTLIKTEKELGSDQWFSYLITRYQNDGLSKVEAYRKGLPLYGHIHNYIKAKPTERSIKKLLAKLQKKTPTIALTARSIKEQTLRQLKKLSFTFNTSGTFPKELIELPAPDHRPAWYEQGIIFCNGNNKGTALFSFLDTVKTYTPERIIFVDDKMSHVQAVEKAAQERNIDFIGIHYTGQDKEIAAFNAGNAEQQLRTFLRKHPLPKESVVPTYMMP